MVSTAGILLILGIVFLLVGWQLIGFICLVAALVVFLARGV